MNSSTGALAALGTAVSWTVTALAFEYAGKRIGAFALNFLRLFLGFLFLGLYCLVTRGSFLPLDAPGSAWIWLSISGVVGFVIGDLLLFQAFIDIGSRVSMLIFASAPALTAVLGFGFLGEKPAGLALIGMALTMAGIAVVVLGKGATDAAASGHEARPRRLRIRGLLCAAGGALGQAVGLILSKVGVSNLDPFAGTQIRVTAGVLSFAVVLFVVRAWKGTWVALRDRKAVASLSLGAFFGPFLGVSLSLLAVQSTEAGVAAAIMSIIPVLIIAPSALIYRERVHMREVLGSLVAVSGVFILLLG
ncbi:MAG TPA: DMT family transporter [Rectinemataceae bacterium]|nr:DMT family transporter [Rectinemataceae bacterium]